MGEDLALVFTPKVTSKIQSNMKKRTLTFVSPSVDEHQVHII